MAAQDACRGQHFLVHVALCVPNMSISISMWVRPVLWGIERSGFFNDRGKWVKSFENQRV